MKKIIVLIALLLLSGCATGSFATGPEKQFQAAAVSVKENRYKEAAAAYKKISVDAPGSELAADALFELALVYAHHNNPDRDYAKAARSFEEFLKRYPNHKRSDEAQTWLTTLKAVQELKKQNEYLTKSIEELKRLDIRHEQRRRK